MSNYRQKLNSAFWQIVKMISGGGVDGKETAYDMIEERYGHRSLSRLTNDELKAVVDMILGRTGVQLTKVKGRQNRKPAHATRRAAATGGAMIELATPAQLEYIEGLADEIEISNFSLGAFIIHMHPGELITVAVAASLIEAMKGMAKRKWRGNTADPEHAYKH